MNTTNLFVELVVIGVGAFAWVVLLILSVFDYYWVPFDQVFSIPALVPLLSIIYVLGIISDRVADAVFEKWWGDKLRRVWFKDRKQYHDARLRILCRSERMWALLEYGRSRLRICRGWAFNSILIALSLNAFAWTRMPAESPAVALSAFGTVALLIMAVGSWYAWRKLNITEYRKIKEQVTFLAETDSERQASDSA